MTNAAKALSDSGNDRIAMGGNLPPDVMAFNIIDAYYDEARNWASDGFKIENQAQADEIDALDKALLKAQQDADELREAEKKPHDDASKAVQAKYNPYVQKDKGKTYVARGVLKSLLTAWRVEQQRIAEEKARKAREEADAERRAAEEAMRASSGDLEAREQAEQQVEAAKQAERVAKKADKAATTGTGLRTSWVPKLTDRNAAIKHYWAKDPGAFERLVMDMALTEVRHGIRTIPGFEIEEVKVAI